MGQQCCKMIGRATEFKTVYNEEPTRCSEPFSYCDFTGLGNDWVKFEGSFVSDQKHGKGELTFTSSERFVGSWANDNVHGEGTMFLNDGKVVKGVWCNNKLQLKHYDGHMKNGSREGKGTDFAGGLISYHGHWANNKYHGCGRIYSTNYQYTDKINYQDTNEIGNYWVKYDGDFKNGMKDGQGTLTMINGERLVGSFANCKPVGAATVFRNNGEV